MDRTADFLRPTGTRTDAPDWSVVHYETIDRTSTAFQQPVADTQIAAIFRRAFGAQTIVESATELGFGAYNSTFRCRLANPSGEFVLRVAPEESRQFRSERRLMRNEYATIPWLAPISDLIPRTVFADWSHDLLDRDYLIQSVLPGIPGPVQLDSYPRAAHGVYFRQLGEICRRIHDIEGPAFGAVAAAAFDSWSAALAASLELIAVDVAACGLRSDDLQSARRWVQDNRSVFDGIGPPRLLAGDLWTVNVMLEEDAPQPQVSGILDLDRTLWGDPAADWTIRMAKSRPGTERDSFWETYGPPEASPGAALRAIVYEVRHLGAIRLERHRLGDATGTDGTYGAVDRMLVHLP